MNKGGLYSFSDGIEIASGENVGTAFWMIPPPVTVPPISGLHHIMYCGRRAFFWTQMNADYKDI
jgi:hypothetical protein